MPTEFLKRFEDRFEYDADYQRAGLDRLAADVNRPDQAHMDPDDEGSQMTGERFDGQE